MIILLLRPTTILFCLLWIVAVFATSKNCSKSASPSSDMHLALIVKILGMLLMVFSTTMLPPVLVAWIYDDGMQLSFLSAFAITFVSGMALWLAFFRVREELGVRDGFLVVTLFWTVLGMIGSLPFVLILDVSATDAVFESMSGLTTTGASVLSGLDEMAPSLLYYRQQLQWLGGMGVVVLAVAILPMLGVGGMQLYKAEIPGPMKESKLTPRIAETAKALWYVYLLVTVSCVAGYWFAGLPLFEAICHSFSTVSTGGFSTRDASMAAFDSAAVDWVARSEEHTSELQSRPHLVCRLLLEKKKKKKFTHNI